MAAAVAASLVVARSAASAIAGTLTLREALSGIFGSVSLATWIFLLVSRRFRKGRGCIEEEGQY